MRTNVRARYQPIQEQPDAKDVGRSSGRIHTAASAFREHEHRSKNNHAHAAAMLTWGGTCHAAHPPHCVVHI
eukprot:1138006-Pelagomonas_calceolata.AAC.5